MTKPSAKNVLLTPLVDTESFSSSVYAVEGGMPLDIAATNPEPGVGANLNFEFGVVIAPDGRVRIDNTSDYQVIRGEMKRQAYEKTVTVASQMVVECTTAAFNTERLDADAIAGTYRADGYTWNFTTTNPYKSRSESDWHTHPESVFTCIGIDTGSPPTVVLGADGQKGMPAVQNGSVTLESNKYSVTGTSSDTITDRLIESALGDGYFADANNTVSIPTGRSVILGADAWHRAPNASDPGSINTPRSAMFVFLLPRPELSL